MVKALIRTFRPRSRRRRAVFLRKKEGFLVDLPLNLKARVVRIDPSDPGQIHRLASLGILPGATLRLIRKRGAFLALLDRYQVAFDRKVARSIWVALDGN